MFGTYCELTQAATATFGKRGLISSAKRPICVLSSKAVVAWDKMGEIIQAKFLEVPLLQVIFVITKYTPES